MFHASERWRLPDNSCGPLWLGLGNGNVGNVQKTQCYANNLLCPLAVCSSVHHPACAPPSALCHSKGTRCGQSQEGAHISELPTGVSEGVLGCRAAVKQYVILADYDQTAHSFVIKLTMTQLVLLYYLLKTIIINWTWHFVVLTWSCRVSKMMGLKTYLGIYFIEGNPSPIGKSSILVDKVCKRQSRLILNYWWFNRDECVLKEK